MGNSRQRTAQQVVDAAIAENRSAGRVLFALAAVAASVGLGVLVWACVARQPAFALAGSICTGLLWPAMRFAQQIRKENIALRLLETPLGKAQTALAAAEMLEHLFLRMFLTERLDSTRLKSGGRLSQQVPPEGGDV